MLKLQFLIWKWFCESRSYLVLSILDYYWPKEFVVRLHIVLSRFVWCFHQKASMWKMMLSHPFHLHVFMFHVPSYSVYQLWCCRTCGYNAKRIHSLCKMDGTSFCKLHFLMVALHWKEKSVLCVWCLCETKWMKFVRIIFPSRLDPFNLDLCLNWSIWK